MSTNYLKAATNLLHTYKLKVTKPRLKILIYLMSHHNHPTAATIYQEISGEQPTYKATVYNTLNKLVAAGIVIEIKNGDNASHYDYFVKPHFHIICTNCGKIADVFEPDLTTIENKMRTEAERQTNFITSASHLEIFGLCPVCQKKAQKNKS
ncbi:Fur family transcriptional regulator [Lactobacillus sp. ESL0785]|uniref:Fur family transcriptional regulator n=1 Tax=Lactobacillus sp. ESL0785 TaxID=2983232 RepID=UPI0023F97B06|nr:Fur family transcriptional regulator [Lactobacillus sp. ESL0785]WEV71396.1 Fur family transcriptional regulator [Lactobacillus sp. ESL0785]